MLTEHARALASRLGRDGVQLQVGPFLARIRSELPSVASHLDLLYPDYPMTSAAEGHFDVALVEAHGFHRWVRRQAILVVDGRRPYLPLPVSLAGAAMEWGLNGCIGNRAHRWVAVHAAVVERAGRAAILSAPSGSGKSTLCAAMVYAGWRLFSDEFAIIDPDSGWLLPAPRPISLKEGAIDVIRRRHPALVCGPEGRDVEKTLFVHARPPAESVRRSSEQAPPALLIFPRYVPGAATAIEPMPKARALIQLAGQSFNFNYLGARGFETLVRLVRDTACYRLEYSDLDDVLRRLGDLIAG